MSTTDFPTGAVRILARLKSCGCGCKGRDTWHRHSYQRLLRNPNAVTPQTAETCWDGGRGTPIQAEAWAQFPWGLTRVVLMERSPDRPAWWVVDRNSMLEMMNSTP